MALMIKEVAHTVLYRKYRPERFEDVVGQETVINLVESAVKSGKPAHAYLFTGGRGLGKTTVARIFAKELNTKPTDIYEIDAASKRGIDDIRELREHVRGTPMESKYKVYIIDEVHMLTKEAFNALLKTLEEPPAHAIFILATTEFDKVPDTIKSRTQMLQFKHPTQEILELYITDIAKKELIKITKEAVSLLAQLADKSYRDACGRLEEANIHSADGEINADIIANSFGVPNSVLINKLLEAIVLSNAESASSAIGTNGFANINHELLLNMLLMRIRSLHMLRHKMIKLDEVEKTFGKDEANFLNELANNKDNKLNSAIIIKLLDALVMVKRSPVKSLPLELAISDILG